MKRKVVLLFLIVVIAFLSGCGTDEYSIERRFWYARKEANNIFNNPFATPPRELERVVSTFQNFIQDHPQSPLAVRSEFLIGRLYTTKQMYNKARAQFSGITIKYKDNNTLCSEAIFFIGNSFEAEDKWDSALQEYKKIMDKYPVTPKGLEIPFYITKYYETKNELDKMIGAYKEAVAYYDSLSLKYADTQFGFLAMNLKAQSYMALKDWESAIGTYYDVLRKYQGKLPLDDVLMKIALIYDRQLEDKVKTKDILERLIKEYPKSRFRDLAAGVLEELNENN